MAGERTNDIFKAVRADLAAARRTRLGELAVARGLLTAEQIEKALAEGRALEEALVSNNLLRPSQVEDLLRELDGPPSGPSISRYEAGDKLGEGAVSIVFRGTDRELGRPVALKFLRDGLLANEKARERFHREAQSLARMDHPNVVKVHDVARKGDQVFLVMELVEGEPLGRLLQRDPRACTPLLEQAARGVQHAHEKGIVHRDLKPDNILVAGGIAAKVVDFGLAHLAEAGPALTHTGTVLGTPLYMAPEQVSARGEVTPRTDVYALGAILYQALAGQPPHEAATVTQVYEKILREDPVPPRKINPAAPAALEAVALKAMEKDPARRYASAGAFADDLRRFLAGENVEARSVPAVVRSARRLLRNRALVSGAGFLALAVLIAGVTLLAGRGRLREALDEAARREREGLIQGARDEYQRALGIDASSSAARQGALRTDAALRRVTNFLEASRPHLDRAYRATYEATTPVEEVGRSAAAAQDLVEQALALASDVALVHYRLGEILEIQGWYDRAAASFRRATELDARSGPARYRLGRILLWQAYLAQLNMWTIEDPADRARGEALATAGAKEIEAARAEGSGFDDDLRRDVAAAMLAYLRRRKDEALRLCAEGVKRFAGREGVEEFHWLSGLVEQKSEAQRPAYDAALAIRPRFPLALYSRAWVGGGIKDYDLAIRAAPGFAEAYIFRASCYLLDLKDYPKALADFDELVKRGVHLAPGYNGRGVTKLRIGDVDGAIADLTEAIRIRPQGYHLPYSHRAEAFFQKGDYDGAIADSTRAMEIRVAGDPRTREHLVRGRARAAKGDRAGAVEDLKKAGPAGVPFLKELDAGK